MQKKPFRVGMVVYNVYSRDARVRRYAEYLAADGCLIDIICLDTASREPQSNNPNIRVFPIPKKKVRYEGWKQALQWALDCLSMFWYMSRLDFKNKYDLIHIHNMPNFLVFCALFPKLRGCPVILDLHDPIPELARSKLDLPANHIIIKIIALEERICGIFSNHMITAVPTFKNRIVDRGAPEDKVTVIYNLPDPHLFDTSSGEKEIREKAPGEPYVMLYIGTIAKRYGLDVVIRALPSLKESIPEIKLKIIPKVIDEGEGLENILELAEELGVRSLIEVVNPVPLDKMPDVIRKADIGIYPARRDCQQDAALSLKVPEMARMGLPMVTSRLTVLEKVFGEDAIAFFPAEDSQGFAARVCELQRSPESARRFAQNALHRILELTWEAQYTEYKSVIQRLTGREL